MALAFGQLARSITGVKNGSVITVGDPLLPPIFSASPGDTVANLTINSLSIAHDSVLVRVNGGAPTVLAANTASYQITGLTNNTAYSVEVGHRKAGEADVYAPAQSVTPSVSLLQLSSDWDTSVVRVPSTRGPRKLTVGGPPTDVQFQVTPYGVICDFSVVANGSGLDYAVIWSTPGSLTSVAACQAVFNAGANVETIDVGQPHDIGMAAVPLPIVFTMSPATQYDVALIHYNGSNVVQWHHTETLTTAAAPNVSIPVSGLATIPQADYDAARARYLANDTIVKTWVDHMVAEVVTRNNGTSFNLRYMHAGALAYKLQGSTNTAALSALADMVADWVGFRAAQGSAALTGDSYRFREAIFCTRTIDLLAGDFGLGASANQALVNSVAEWVWTDDFPKVTTHVGDADTDQYVTEMGYMMINGAVMKRYATVHTGDWDAIFNTGRNRFFAIQLPQYSRDNRPYSLSGGRAVPNPEYLLGEYGYHWNAWMVARACGWDMSAHAQWLWRQFRSYDIYNKLPISGLATWGAYWPYGDLDDSNVPMATAVFGQADSQLTRQKRIAFALIIEKFGMGTEAGYIKRILDLATPTAGDDTHFERMLYDGDHITAADLPSNFPDAYVDSGQGFAHVYNGTPARQGNAHNADAGIFVYTANHSGLDHAMKEAGMTQLAAGGRMHFGFRPRFVSGAQQRIGSTYYRTVPQINRAATELEADASANGQRFRHQGNTRIVANFNDANYFWQSMDLSEAFPGCSVLRLVMYRKNKGDGRNAVLIVDRAHTLGPNDGGYTTFHQNWNLFNPVIGVLTPLIGNAGAVIQTPLVNSVGTLGAMGAAESDSYSFLATGTTEGLLGAVFELGGALTRSVIDNGSTFTATLDGLSVTLNKNTMVPA